MSDTTATADLAAPRDDRLIVIADLGPGPVPTSAEDASARFRDADPRSPGLTVAMTPRNTEIGDLTAEVRQGELFLPTPANGFTEGDAVRTVRGDAVTERRPVLTREARLELGIATGATRLLQVHGEARDLMLEWALEGDGRLLALSNLAEQPSLTGSFTARAMPAEIVAWCLDLYGDRLPMRVRDPHLSVQVVDASTVRVSGGAKVSKGILGASLSFSGTARCSGSTVTLTDAHVSSGNPLVKAMLTPVQSMIAKRTAEPVDLNDLLPAHIGVTSVRFQGEGDAVVVEGAISGR